ncbi:hypothetical protein BLNAU_23833 [Blattamonas nauphoetae]|uniref:Uncharacterized protein n=1 Tax=Blattamonas nauphoetae TaxID=2049346 RepID=A0ABQ9WTA4_9EUKA|nr:hypothetical protein BLNAU_23833 [Blattamonas nauphoetae]
MQLVVDASSLLARFRPRYHLGSRSTNRTMHSPTSALHMSHHKQSSHLFFYSHCSVPPRFPFPSNGTFSTSLQLRSHPKADLRFLHHLNRLYALLSSSHHVQRDQALVAAAEDQEGLLGLGVLVNDLDLEELRDLTLAEAFRPTLTTTIANQIRDSPQIWYGFRAGLNEKSIHSLSTTLSSTTFISFSCTLILSSYQRIRTPRRADRIRLVFGIAVPSQQGGTVEEEEYRRGRHTDEGGEEEERGEVVDDAVQRQIFLDLNAAVSNAGQHTKIFRTCYSFDQNRHSAMADRKDTTDEPQVKGREELDVVQFLSERVKEAKKKMKRATLGGKKPIPSHRHQKDMIQLDKIEKKED